MLALKFSGLNSSFKGLKFVWWWGTAPIKEMVKKDRFWNEWTETLDSVGNEYILYILGYLNGCIGDKTRAGITSTFGVPGENDYGRRVEEFCAERGLCVGNTYFKHRILQKYTRVARG